MDCNCGPILNHTRFDEAMEAKLLENGFKYYGDWEFGPVSGWSGDFERYNMNLMKHSFGYWIIVVAHASGENKEFNLGSSNSAEHIIAIRDLLSKLF